MDHNGRFLNVYLVFNLITLLKDKTRKKQSKLQKFAQKICFWDINLKMQCQTAKTHHTVIKTELVNLTNQLTSHCTNGDFLKASCSISPLRTSVVTPHKERKSRAARVSFIDIHKTSGTAPSSKPPTAWRSRGRQSRHPLALRAQGW